MKTIILTSILVLQTIVAFAQTKVQIQTTAVCEMCKSLIEKNLHTTNGIEKATLSLKTKKVLVEFNPSVISADSVRQVITRLGYNADEVSADPKAYQELHSCCKNPRTLRKSKP